jgi:aminoacyl-tRNA hydrolase
MKIICGLGNPGSQYAKNRHNVGFLVLDALASKLKASFDHAKWEAELANAALGGEKLLLLKPQTFMNLSGQALGQAARFYKVGPPEVLVVHDELDLPFGRLQLKLGGGTGGHNGLESIRDAASASRRAPTRRSGWWATCWGTSPRRRRRRCPSCSSARRRSATPGRETGCRRR